MSCGRQDTRHGELTVLVGAAGRPSRWRKLGVGTGMGRRPRHHDLLCAKPGSENLLESREPLH